MSDYQSPYNNLEPRAFWRSGVQGRAPLDPGDVYRPKFPINRDMKIVTAGSCFAQHVGRALKTAGFNLVDAEPAPISVNIELAQKFGYEMYSARYGNIYTPKQLVQLFQEAFFRQELPNPVWEKDGRYYDAQRPNIEPGGHASAELVLEHRKRHLANVRRGFLNCDLFVFTFGLTEAWIDRETETVYPTAPGTIAGTFDPEKYVFKNYNFNDVRRDFETFMKFMRKRNENVRFLVTTSPVPLTATASGHHVEVATSYSKSVLRSVCGHLADTYPHVDYFPSYEIITSLNTRGVYYQSNQRSVSSLGVQTAMTTFLTAHGVTPAPQAPSRDARPDKPILAQSAEAGADEVCEEALLEAFSK